MNEVLFCFWRFLQLAKLFLFHQVLTTCEYIHVKQEEAYGDVLITPRPRLTATKD